ncbi:MAG TPA: cell division ATPase MinD [Candidatus Nanoarchaeia archaeon]|nr:cell division ATPase MinD [Candidatus Nanoarchaeia archaeon]
MQKVIVITSGKGGVGKTTTAINLGAAINHFGGDVLIIDGNMSTPNIGIHLNSPDVPVDLNQVLLGEAEAVEAVYQHYSGIKIVPSSLSITELKKIRPERLKDFKKDFKKISNYILVDSSAGLGKEATTVMEMADELIIVTNPEIAAITDALKTIKIAERMKKPVMGVIVTRVKKDQIEMQPETVREMLEVPILGMIPEHIAVRKSLNMRDAVVHTHPKSPPSRAYKEIAARIVNVKYDSEADKEKILERVMRVFGLRS